MNDEPLAYFLTWTTYGTWLPGDQRGWVEYKRGWQLPDAEREIQAASIMTEEACLLTARQRKIVEQQIAQTCEHRKWRLYAVNCRTNHVHVVVGAPGASPQKVRNDLKAWSTRKLKETSDSQRQKWWSERGSQRYINDEDTLAAVIAYVLEAQDRKHLDQDLLARSVREEGKNIASKSEEGNNRSARTVDIKANKRQTHKSRSDERES